MKKDSLKVYAITNRSWLKGDTLYSQVEKAIIGGATIIQLREKDIDDKEFLKIAIEIQGLCKKYNIPFIINDNVDIAKKINSDGIHVGQSDREVSKVRKEIGKDMILGVSVQTVEQAIYAYNNGADYLGVGAIFPTSSKDDASDVSIETLKKICQTVNIPIVAIGGITSQNIRLLKGSGIQGVAIISAIFNQDDIIQATKNISSEVEKL